MLCSAVDMTCIPEGTRVSSLSARKRELVNLMHDEGESESVLCERQSRGNLLVNQETSILHSAARTHHVARCAHYFVCRVIERCFHHSCLPLQSS